MSRYDLYKKLKSGTDIRGVAVETEGSPVQLDDLAVYDLTCGFCEWLLQNGASLSGRIAVGHDSRISAERIKKQVISALCTYGFYVYDCGLSSTPAMFMTTVELNCLAAVQITASHHPWDRNGLKFFTLTAVILTPLLKTPAPLFCRKGIAFQSKRLISCPFTPKDCAT